MINYHEIYIESQQKSMNLYLNEQLFGLIFRPHEQFNLINEDENNFVANNLMKSEKYIIILTTE